MNFAPQDKFLLTNQVVVRYKCMAIIKGKSCKEAKYISGKKKQSNFFLLKFYNLCYLHFARPWLVF